MYESGYRQEFGLDILFIDHFTTRLMNTLNYSSISDLHILQITIAHVRAFQCAVFSPVVL
jgi:hypothetical protein